MKRNSNHGSPYAVGERCSVCGIQATHKVGEENTNSHQHNLTAYVCCAHFSRIMGPAAGCLQTVRPTWSDLNIANLARNYVKAPTYEDQDNWILLLVEAVSEEEDKHET